MTSFLDVIDADDRDQRVATRKASSVAKLRCDEQFGQWLGSADSLDDFNARLAHVADDITSIAAAAAEEFGAGVDIVGPAIVSTYTSRAASHFAPEQKTAAVHESRKPKMCPFHKDVVDISLASQDPRAGYDSMAQHWGGPRHCEGDGYEGSKCNFKPQMTTQSYWDDKATKAEERKQQRQEQAEQFVNEELESPVEALPDTDVAEFDETIEPASDGAEVIDFPAQDAPEVVEEAEVPMSMAAKVAGDDVTGLGTTETPINKKKWTPQSVPKDEPLKADDPNGPHPTKRKDIIEPIRSENGSKLEEIGEQVTEHVELDSNADNAGFSGGGETSGGPTKTFPKGNQADPVTSAVDDVNKNPIQALLDGEFDGFVPQSVVQSAVAAYRGE